MQSGARRIELCDNLAVGGTTPSYGVTKAAAELAANYDTTIMTMIRPRGGDFVYTDLEIAIARRHSFDCSGWKSRGCIWDINC